MSDIQLICAYFAAFQIARALIQACRDQYAQAAYTQATAAVLLLVAYHGGAA